MTLVKVLFRGGGFGHVYTSVCPTSRDLDIVSIERAELVPLATLAADVLGEEQPLLPNYGAANLARWIVRFGCGRFGERPFLRECARALIWQEKSHR